jgi:hypothetical protein
MVDEGLVKDEDVGTAKGAAVDTAKGVVAGREIRMDNLPRCRNQYHKYRGKNNNKDNTVNNRSAWMEACTSRDWNNRVTWSHIHTD